MTLFSVNINKVATLRNARGENRPDIIRVAKDLQRMGAQGITVHPRPDERHIKYADVPALRQVVDTEYNIEGYPSEDFLTLVTQVAPDQVTLVPDAPDALTSSAGWDVEAHYDQLEKIIDRLHRTGIRASIFVDTDLENLVAARSVGADRVEMYTKPYADLYPTHPEEAVRPFVACAKRAKELGLGVNAGHDLSLDNLALLHRHIPELDEVSIGHAVICEALYEGFETVVRKYLEILSK
ncbi:pyridoxine 5'-phosphate synthase [uncultured Porphyromonas sp.]|uniref:pyridoxine 5'-phosphate synthase n=1 Tax=uncultured Porphyromonas sp. TaxID=159274 RepID=UPI0025F999ED|nr:pyridoxine 5'-phosphate synthase [uncultured Porphyromonas sp.]